MVVTPFGGLIYGNAAAMLQWIAAHGQRHRTYQLALSKAGSSIRPASLFGPISLAWIQVHYAQHLTLLRQLIPDGSVSAQVLAMDFTVKPAMFYTWHRMHNLIHARIDQALGVRS